MVRTVKYDQSDTDKLIATDPKFAAAWRLANAEMIGECLREARQSAGKTIKEVAEAMGVSESRVTQIEREAGSSLNLRSLERFSVAIGCRLDIRFVDYKTDKQMGMVLVGDDRVPEEAETAAEVVAAAK